MNDNTFILQCIYIIYQKKKRKHSLKQCFYTTYIKSVLQRILRNNKKMKKKMITNVFFRFITVVYIEIRKCHDTAIGQQKNNNNN